MTALLGGGEEQDEGPNWRKQVADGVLFCHGPFLHSPLSFPLFVAHLESNLLLPLKFIQPILCFTMVSDWMPQMTMSQNARNPGAKFIQFPKWILQLFGDISDKTDSYSLNPHAALSILSLFIGLFNICLVCLCLCEGMTEHDLRAGFFLSTMWAVILNLNHRLDCRHRYPLGHPSSRAHTRLCDLEAEISFSFFSWP